MIRVILAALTITICGCATGGNGSPSIEHEKGQPSRVMGLAILELDDSPPGLNCTASFLTATVLLTSASCLQFETKQGALGSIQSVETGEFLPVDTIWSLTAPNEPGDLGLIRLGQPPAVVTVFQIKSNRTTTVSDSRFGGTGCEAGVRSARTTNVQLPPETVGICPNGSGGIIFDTEHRQIQAMHIGIQSGGLDQYTELPFYAVQIAQATADLLGAPTLDPSDTATNSDDPCYSAGLYNDGVCNQECVLPDPDCEASETPRCQSANDYLDGQCPPNCDTDPDCRRQQNREASDPCEEQGLYNDGRCDSCPEIDPDCEVGESADFCTDQNLYNNGRCDRCPKPDPDCATAQSPGAQSSGQSGDVCAELGAYGNGRCDNHCPRRDPDCDANNGGNTSTPPTQAQTPPPENESENTQGGSPGNDLCAALNWYNDGECDTVCANPDPDCAQASQGHTDMAQNHGADAHEQDSNDECETYGWYGDGECDTFCANPDPDCEDAMPQNEPAEMDENAQSSDLCEALGWYSDGECDTVCARPDPDC